MRAGTALALNLALLAGSAAAVERKPVVTVEAAPVRLVPGVSAEARIAVEVAEGFHLQANPASEEYLVATKLEVPGGEGVETGRPIYPRGRPYRLKGALDALSTYEARFEIRLPLKASAAAAPGEHVLRGTLHYQACDAKTCLFPASLPVGLRVTVAPSKTKPAKLH